ncbi:MAG: hypothetical protein N4A44_03980 [Alphaproteobacteria bacterium]|jgi:hypothetical protein|nr:hypothetical protein [Alphaproteobacteria bacterium]
MKNKISEKILELIQKQNVKNSNVTLGKTINKGFQVQIRKESKIFAVKTNQEIIPIICQDNSPETKNLDLELINQQVPRANCIITIIPGRSAEIQKIANLSPKNLPENQEEAVKELEKWL